MRTYCEDLNIFRNTIMTQHKGKKKWKVQVVKFLVIHEVAYYVVADGDKLKMYTVNPRGTTTTVKRRPSANALVVCAT